MKPRKVLITIEARSVEGLKTIKSIILSRLPYEFDEGCFEIHQVHVQVVKEER